MGPILIQIIVSTLIGWSVSSSIVTLLPFSWHFRFWIRGGDPIQTMSAALGVMISWGTKTCNLKPSQIGTGVWKVIVWSQVSPTLLLPGSTSIVSIERPYYIVNESASLIKLTSQPILSQMYIAKLSVVSVEIGVTKPLLMLNLSSSFFSYLVSKAPFIVIV